MIPHISDQYGIPLRGFGASTSLGTSVPRRARPGFGRDVFASLRKKLGGWRRLVIDHSGLHWRRPIVAVLVPSSIGFCRQLRSWGGVKGTKSLPAPERRRSRMVHASLLHGGSASRVGRNRLSAGGGGNPCYRPSQLYRTRSQLITHSNCLTCSVQCRHLRNIAEGTTEGSNEITMQFETTAASLAGGHEINNHCALSNHHHLREQQQARNRRERLVRQLHESKASRSSPRMLYQP